VEGDMEYNSFCRVLNSTLIYIMFGQMFQIKFWGINDKSFGGFLKVHITCYKYVSNSILWYNEQKDYLLFELLMNVLATFFL
jgi:hypothetical protein